MILRVAAGFSALAMTHLVSDLTEMAALLARCVIFAVTGLLWSGLWTPIAAIAAAALQIGTLALGQELSAASGVNAALALALAMLGPGSWSLDARLFGRKRII